MRVMKKPVLVILCLLLMVCAHAQQQFNHVFSPLDGFIKPEEKGFRDGVCLNGDWQFSPVQNAALLSEAEIKHPAWPAAFNWQQTAVKVPSPWNVNGFTKDEGGADFVTYPSYPKAWDTVRAGWLRKTFRTKESWKAHRLLLHFEAVAGYAVVFVNGKEVKHNFDVFLPFEVDVTNLVKWDGENEITLWVADADLLNKPGKYGRRLYVGGSFWGQFINGIWQDVNLLVTQEVYIKDAYVKPYADRGILELSLHVTNSSKRTANVNLGAVIKPWINKAGKGMIEAPEPNWELAGPVVTGKQLRIQVPAGTDSTFTLTIQVGNALKLWTLEDPNLYAVITHITNGKDTLDKKYDRFGWRSFSIKGNHFFLNGKRVIMKGDSWHFMGVPQMTRRYAWAWYTALKQANGNTVRLHAQPYPSFYLDMADEMGILVLDETGLWASDGGPKEDSKEYWENADDHVQRMILRDRNHPAVMGWSVCNENIPVAVFVHHSPDSLVTRQLNAINHWVHIAKQYDSTRSWISGDGETGKPTTLPVILGHYGDENSYKEWSSRGTVWGVGECGMAYYGTPKQTSVYNGDRSYVSQQGRMEALDIEAVQLFDAMKKYDASYMSVFNLVWYGLKPLAFGLADTTRLSKPTDGIFFTKYKEAQPGMQPERLGPYTSTLNPGYDPTLPLFKPWPLYEGMKQSFATSNEIKSPKRESPVRPVLTSYQPFKSAVLLSADSSHALNELLQKAGVQVSAAPDKKETTLVLLDGVHPPSDRRSKKMVQSVLQAGGAVFVFGVHPNTLEALNAYMEKPVQILTHPATSYIVAQPDQLINKLGNADFYFSELSREPISSFAIGGSFFNSASSILVPCNTNWQQWNNRPESAKTISTIRSENVDKPGGSVLSVYQQGKGRTYVCAIDPFKLNGINATLLYRLLNNLGVPFNGKQAANLNALAPDRWLENAMLSDGTTGTIISAVDHKIDFTNKHNKTLGFWVYSPRSLSNLLAEPDMPVLDLHVEASKSLFVIMNGKPLEPTSSNSYKAVQLERGWNHFEIKTGDYSGSFGLRFNSDNRRDLREMDSKVDAGGERKK